MEPPIIAQQPQVQATADLLTIVIHAPVNGGALFHRIKANPVLGQDVNVLRAATLAIIAGAVDFMRQVEAGQTSPSIIIPPPGMLKN